MASIWCGFPLPARPVAGATATPTGDAPGYWIMPTGQAIEVEWERHKSSMSELMAAGVLDTNIPPGWMTPPHWIRVSIDRGELCVNLGILPTNQAVHCLAGLCRRMPAPKRAVLDGFKQPWRMWEQPADRNPAGRLAAAVEAVDQMNFRL